METNALKLENKVSSGCCSPVSPLLAPSVKGVDATISKAEWKRRYITHLFNLRDEFARFANIQMALLMVPLSKRVLRAALARLLASKWQNANNRSKRDIHLSPDPPDGTPRLENYGANGKSPTVRFLPPSLRRFLTLFLPVSRGNLSCRLVIDFDHYVSSFESVSGFCFLLITRIFFVQISNFKSVTKYLYKNFFNL